MSFIRISKKSLLSVRVCPKGIAAAARRMHRIGGRKAGAVRVCPKGIAAAARRMHRIGGRKKSKKRGSLGGLPMIMND